MPLDRQSGVEVEPGHPGYGVREGGGDDAVHVRIGVLTLCGLDPATRIWVEAVNGARADCWTCQRKLEEATDA